MFETQVNESLAMERLLATLSGFFGVLALALAMIGLYGLMSYNVARRRNEIGIRIALGAAQSRVLGLVLGEVGRMTVLGVVLGVAAALATSRLLKAFLFGLSATDPLTLIAATVLLLFVGALAGYLPARRASRMDPMVALREEG
jgi:ABC-type antimicrobial peptide transport system permease subunit